MSGSSHQLFDMINCRKWEEVTQFLSKHDHDRDTVGKEAGGASGNEQKQSRRSVSVKELLLEKNRNSTSNKSGCNPLQLACEFNAPLKLILKMIEIGGSELVLQKNNDGYNSLHCAFYQNAHVEVVMSMIEIGGRDAVRDKNSNGWNALFYACYNKSPLEVVSKVIDAGGGRDIVVEKDYICCNSLHVACRYRSTVEVVCKLIEVGGRDLVLDKDRYGRTALHYYVEKSNASSIEVISKMIGVEERKDLVRGNGNRINKYTQKTRHHYIVSKLIEIGGKDIVLKQDSYGRNPLHSACQNNVAPVDVVAMIIEVGGRDVVLQKNKGGLNPLHCICSDTRSCITSDMLDLFTNTKQGQGGAAEVLSQTNHVGKTPLQVIITKPVRSWLRDEKRTLVENAILLINKGIQLQVGGEYGIGGLFNPTSNQVTRDEIYRNWDNLPSFALEHILSLPNNQNLPILQAAIINKTPPHIIKGIISRFNEFVNTKDSLGQYPIDVAVNCRLSWDDGMKEIIQIFSSAQLSAAIYICAKHGVQWENGTRNVIEETGLSMLEREDEITGLYPFMLAATGGKYKYDLGSVFHMIERSSGLLRGY